MVAGSWCEWKGGGREGSMRGSCHGREIKFVMRMNEQINGRVNVKFEQEWDGNDLCVGFGKGLVVYNRYL